MFVDLVGSTALSARLDPEEMREVLRAYQNTVAGEIARFEGHVAKLMGDGVLACFGWPRAHEDDAERAVRAGLAVAGAIGRLLTPAGEPLAARVGIATGLVVVGGLVGEGAAREEVVVGDTPNLAARLQVLAEPGGVVISDATRRLVGGVFDLKDLGPRSLKGIDAPVRAFAVTGERAVEDRFAAHQSGAPLPLVGREQELVLLLDRWRLARGGEGQVVLLSGEPGIGKSRLVLALRERLRAEPRTSVRYNCSPFHQNSALHPAIEQLGPGGGLHPRGRRGDEVREAGGAGGPGDGSRRGRPLPRRPARPAAGRASRAPAAHPAGEEGAHLPGAAGPARGTGAPEPRPAGPRGRALVRPDHARAVRPGGRAHRVAAGAPRRHLPPRVRAALGRRQAHVTSLVLNRLGRAEARAIVDRVAGGRELPADLLDAIVARTDGVPLFVEELTKAVLEAGLLRDEGDRYILQGPLPPLAIPSTLHGSLLARLDRLAAVRKVAQVAACDRARVRPRAAGGGGAAQQGRAGGSVGPSWPSRS